MKLRKMLLLGALVLSTSMMCPIQTAGADRMIVPQKVTIVKEEVSEQPIEEVIPVYEEHYVYTTTRVNVREYPTIDSAVMTILDVNTKLLRTGEEVNGWDCVKVDNQELFIKHDYLSTEPVYKSIGKYDITAYCACAKCCGKSDGITASGTKATQGRTVACNFLPFGTEVIINGHTYIVEDTGSKTVMGNHTFDIFFDSHEEALIHVRKYVEVFVKNY